MSVAMLTTYAFVALAAILVFFAAMILESRRLIRAVLALTGVFFMSSLIILLLGQPLVALLQLIILVGGMSTYLIVAVAAEHGHEESVSGWVFALLFVLLFAALMPLVLVESGGIVSGSGNFLASAANDFSSYTYLFFLIALLVAASAIGSVVLIKRVVRLIL